ncbi:MAG: hypothetical protein ACI8Q9_002249 [Planctomycetota bacterium]
MGLVTICGRVVLSVPVTYRAAHFLSLEEHFRTAHIHTDMGNLLNDPPFVYPNSRKPSPPVDRPNPTIAPQPLKWQPNSHSPTPQSRCDLSRGVSASSRVEESLGDGPLDVQSLPIISGRPGSGILLLTEAPGAQHPHPSEAPNRSKPGIKT